MTQKDFLNRLKILAEVCEFRLSTDLVALYDRAMRRFGYESATTAVEAAIMERRGQDRMPSIGDLVNRCAPQLSEADTAIEVAGRIWTAISKFGQYNAADASRWIGDIGWYVVNHNGGWARICETANAKDVGIWKAQLRDHVASAIRRHKAGVLGVAPTFGEIASGQQKVAALCGEVLKKSEKYDGSARIAGKVSPAPEPRELEAQGHSGVT